MLDLIVIVIPWARVACLIYTPGGHRARAHISGEPRAPMAKKWHNHHATPRAQTAHRRAPSSPNLIHK